VPQKPAQRPTGPFQNSCATIRRTILSRAPLTNEPDSAILARVAMRVVRRRVKALGRTDIPPSSIVYSASYLLPHDGFTDLRFALHSLAAHLSCGYTSQAWLAGVCYRSAFGGNFRWHFFAEYKANRRATPRVTNRGGHFSRSDVQSGLRKGSDDA